jgi:nicotinamide-nucleotide amidase
MSNPSATAFVVSQGEELLTGLTVDTNSAWLCGRLTDLGFRVLGAATAGDRRDAIAEVLDRAAACARVTICTGGLGPTEDDLTAEAAAHAFGGAVVLDDQALQQVVETFRRAGRPMSDANRRQAMIPSGARVLPNALGTAPGFVVVRPDGARLYFLPGVPSEMRAMWRDVVRPELLAEFAIVPPRRHVFRVMGRGESQLQDLLGDVIAGFEGIELGFRTVMPENQVKLVADPSIPQDRFGEAVAAVRELLGRDLFSEDQDLSLAGCIGELLVQRGEQLALAESCTGGLIGHLCVTEAGSSRWLERGFVTYSNAAKISEVAVSEETLETHGAVSEEVAAQMAAGARAVAGVQWGIGVTGIAGPGGGTPDKPVGTVCIAIDGPGTSRVRRLVLPARGREMVRRFSAVIALDMLRRQIVRLG